MNETICFIPARDSSTRFKNKNISKFGNGNLISNTIEQALECKIFDRIILSSNNQKILNIGKFYKIETYLRSDKHDQIIDVIRNDLSKIDNIEKESVIGLLLVTCPLRQIEDIKKAYEIFEENDRYHSVVSVKQNENPIQISWKVDEGGHLIPVMPKEFFRSTRKQDHYKTYCFNDAIIFDKVKNFLNPLRNLFGFDPIPYLMPWERSIFIDYEFQLKLARLIRREEW